MISQEELDRLGLDPASLKIKHPMTGEEGYRIGIEVFHQLHCLNLLRMATYREWYSLESVGGDVATDDEDLRGHVGKQETQRPRSPNLY
jgi:mycotoxin biosynthesis protein UstYa